MLRHVKSAEIVDLRPLGDGLAQARTVALAKTKSFEAIRLVVRAGAMIPTHRVSGAITLHCLEGCVSIGHGDSELELSKDEWVFFDGGVEHWVKGMQDSSVLLTILFQK